MNPRMLLVMGLAAVMIAARGAYAVPPEESVSPAVSDVSAKANDEAKTSTYALAAESKDVPFYKHSHDRDEIREMMDAVMATRLSEELDLSDAEMVVMLKRLGEFKDMSRELRKARYQTLRELRELASAAGPEAEVEAKLKEVIARDTELVNLRSELFEQLGDDLSITQRARLYLCLDKFESDMRRLVQRARQRAAGWRSKPSGEGGGDGEQPESSEESQSEESTHTPAR